MNQNCAHVKGSICLHQACVKETGLIKKLTNYLLFELNVRG